MRIIYYWTCTSATLLIYLSIFSIIDSTNSASLMSQKRSRRHVIDLQNPKDVIQVLELLDREVHAIEENPNEQKRGFDLGLARGFSGNQAAKHLLGLSVANSANVPGKRRAMTRNNNFDENNMGS